MKYFVPFFIFMTLYPFSSKAIDPIQEPEHGITEPTTVIEPVKPPLQQGLSEAPSQAPKKPIVQPEQPATTAPRSPTEVPELEAQSQATLPENPITVTLEKSILRLPIKEAAQAALKDNPSLNTVAIGAQLADALGTLNVLAAAPNDEVLVEAINTVGPELDAIIAATQSINPQNLSSYSALLDNQQALKNLFSQNRSLDWYKTRIDGIIDEITKLGGFENPSELVDSLSKAKQKLAILKSEASSKIDQLNMQLNRSFVSRAIERILATLTSLLTTMGFKSPSSSALTAEIKQMTPQQAKEYLSSLSGVKKEALDNVASQLEGYSFIATLPEGDITQDAKASHIQSLEQTLLLLPRIEEALTKAADTTSILRQQILTDPSTIDLLARVIRSKSETAAQQSMREDMLEIFNASSNKTQGTTVSPGNDMYSMLSVRFGA
jgi:hypothetical protein